MFYTNNRTHVNATRRLVDIDFLLLQFSGGASAVNQIAETPTQVK